MKTWKIQTGLWTMLLTLGLALAGCGLDAGYYPVPDEDPSTAQFKSELEIIPGSALVTQNTLPRWQLGRCAFERGINRLLVATNITSFGKYQGKDKAVINRKDRIMERLWITIPQGTELGAQLDLGTLDYKHLIGYDAGYIGDGQFIEPYAVSGDVALLEVKADSAEIYINMLVTPKNRPTWSIKGKFTVPVTSTGIRATKLETGPDQMSVKHAPIAPVTTVTPPATQPQTQPAEPSTQPVAGPAASQPAAGERGKFIIGMWTTDIPPWELRWQFDADGKFVLARTRGVNPMVHEGTYTLKGDYAVLHVTAYYELKGTYKLDHMKYVKQPYLALKVLPGEDGSIALAGPLQDIDYSGTGIKLASTSFPDMWVTPMPKEKSH